MADTMEEILHKRLRFIEGQARGVQRMLEEKRDTDEIMTQLMAIQSAVGSAADLITKQNMLLRLEESITQAVQNCIGPCDFCDGLASKVLGEVDYSEVLEELVKYTSKSAKKIPVRKAQKPTTLLTK